LILRNFYKVLGPKRDMPDFVVKNARKNLCSVFIASSPHPLQGGRCHIKAACLKDHRDDCEARSDIVTRLESGLPQPSMRGQRTVVAAQSLKFAREQRKMHRLIRCDIKKIADELLSHLRTEATGHIKRKINRDEFNVRQGMP